MKEFILSNGRKIPSIGLGTFKLTNEEAYNSVLYALEAGYRLIDTANIYKDEEGVGRAIAHSNIDRKDIYLETKIWPTSFLDKEVIHKTLKRLGVTYLDLVLLHQPCGNYIEGYKLLEKAYKNQEIRAIGLSNFNIEEIKQILSICSVKPVLLQVENHPFCQNKELKEFCEKNGIILQSWFPFGGKGNNTVLENEVINKIAKKYNKNASQIVLRWNIENGYIPVPGSRSKEHIIENFDIFNFSLSKEDLKELDNLNKEEPFHKRSEEAFKRYLTMKVD